MINPFNYIKISSYLELTYTDKNNEAFPFNAKVIEILPDRIKMSQPVNKIESFNIVEPYDRLDMNFYMEEGVFSANVNFLDFENDNIYISYPYNNSFIQRRTLNRTPIHIDCELNILNTGSGVMDTHYFKTKDISESGAACITKKPLPDFDNARLIMHFETVDIIIFCQKVYSKEIELNDEKIYLNGLKFNEMSKDDTKLLNKETLKFQFNSNDNNTENSSF